MANYSGIWWWRILWSMHRVTRLASSLTKSHPISCSQCCISAIYKTRTAGAAGPLVLESDGPIFFTCTNPTTDGPLVLESGISVIPPPHLSCLYLRETQGKFKTTTTIPTPMSFSVPKKNTGKSFERHAKILRGL